jgi:glycosyltransferase involved in cell wall biosynthesis
MDWRSQRTKIMTHTPTVSIIIIFWNAAKFINEAIGSVLAQTYDDWELLLVDDGSTDASTNIAVSYLEQYPSKVRYLEHEGHQNRGMSASRNLGVRNAKGKYLAFLDSDDVWLPRKLYEQIRILDSQPAADMVYGPCHAWYGWTGNSVDICSDRIPNLRVQLNRLYNPPKLIKLFLEHENAMPGNN